MNDQPSFHHTPADDRPSLLAGQNGLAVPRATQHVSYVTTEAPLALWPATTETKTRSFDLHRLLTILRRRKKLLLGTFLGVMLLSVLYVIFTPRVYQATAKLQAVGPSTDSNNATDLNALTAMMGVNQARTMQTQVEILKDDSIKDAALKHLRPEDQTIAKRYAAVTVEPLTQADLIEVSALTRSPQVSTNLANALCAAYINLSEQQNQRTTRGATKYVEDQLATVRAKLDTETSALKAYKQRTGIFNVSQQSTALADQLNRIESDWRAARATKAAATAQLGALRAQVAHMAPSSTVPTGIVRRPAVESMQAELTRLQLDRIAKLREFKPHSRVITDLDAQIAAIRQRMGSEAQTQVQGWRVEPNLVRNGAMQDIAKLQEQVWAVEAQGHALKNASAETRQQLAKLPEAEQRVGQLTMDVGTLQQTYQTLSQKLQSLRITEKAHVANAAVLFPATLGGVDLVQPKLLRTLVMGFMGGLFLALALVAGAEWLDDRVHTEEEATDLLHLPVLAQIPRIDERGQQSLYQQVDGPSPLLESFQMLRTSIDFSNVDTPIRSIVLTSSVPNEGKSMSALNLAVAAAVNGERVVLVDCDLRRPTQHRLCGLPNTVGFSNVLAGTHSLQEAIQETKIPGLRVLTAGIAPPNPFKLLKSKAASTCLQQITQMADLVVIDTPPVLVLADAQVVATLADATLIVISARDARRREVTRTSTALAQTRADTIGIILNKMDNLADGYYQYKYTDSYTSPEAIFDQIHRKRLTAPSSHQADEV